MRAQVQSHLDRNPGLPASERALVQEIIGDLSRPVTDVEVAKKIHYNRNLLNQTPTSLEAALQQRDANGQPFWRSQPEDDDRNAFHRIGLTPEEILANANNKKLLSVDGLHELIYRPDGTIVTDPKNAGTYNFAASDSLHFDLDVIPWLLWGSAADDGTTLALRSELMAKGAAAQVVGGVENGIQAVSGWWGEFQMSWNNSLQPPRDPLIVDLGNGGIALRSMAESGIFFDMDNDGLKEATGWITAEDGFVAIDENGNGIIDNVGELIGDPGQSGFAELATYDSNADGVIDSADAIWSSLRIWRDLDEDGETDPGELQSLAANDIRSFGLSFTTVNFTASENLIHEQGAYEDTSGTQRLLVDVWLQTDSVNTVVSGAVTPSAAAAALPNIRGYGEVPDLHTAMTQDPALLAMVSAFVDLDPSDFHTVPDRIEAILYQWAGTAGVDPAGRGPHVDGRRLATMEVISSTPWVDTNGNVNPPSWAASQINAAWSLLVDEFTARFLAVGPLSAAMEGALYSTTVDAILTLQTLDAYVERFAERAPTDPRDAVVYWQQVSVLIDQIGASQGLSLSEIDAAKTPYFEQALLYWFAGRSPALHEAVFDERGQTAAEWMLTQNAVYLLGDQDNTVTTTTWAAVFSGAGNDHVTAGNASLTAHTGRGTDVILGNRYGDIIDGGGDADYMAGGGGNDLYVVDNLFDIVEEQANGGSDTIRSSVDFDLGLHVEHFVATGSRDVDSTGNASANSFVGNAGRNIFEGLAGNDTYTVSSGDQILERAFGGTDLVQADIDYVLAAYLENLTLLGTRNLSATGNGTNNVLRGNDGNNVIDGRGGADTMEGGAGDDTYYFDNSSDRIFEYAGEGTDLVYSWVGINLGDHIENAILMGTADIGVTGGTGQNRLIGNEGRNQISGGGDADFMAGGAGDDTYYVDHAGDIVVEHVDHGHDRVVASIDSYTLTGNVEILEFQYLATGATGTGNALDNSVEGSSYDDTLSGLDGDDTLLGYNGDDSLIGGAGDDSLVGGRNNDTLEGGRGDDALIGEDDDDVLRGGDGHDLLLGGNGDDQINGDAGNDILDGSQGLDTLNGGNGHDSLSGGSDADSLTGGNGNDTLDGGTGADTMAGGAGNDLYVLDNVGDTVVELAGEGIDTILVQSSIFNLAPEIENVTVTSSGTVDVNGNAASNILIGGSGANTLNGLGGADIMIGRGGDDVYTVDHVGDRVIEKRGEGLETVRASIDYQLSASVNTLEMLGTTAILGAGNESANTLLGNAADNILIGGLGSDTMTGGGGADVFRYTRFEENVADRITDFSVTEDRIDVARMLADLGYSGTDPFADNLLRVLEYSSGVSLELDAHALDPAETFADWSRIVFLDGVAPGSFVPAQSMILTGTANLAPYVRSQLAPVGLAAGAFAQIDLTEDYFGDFDGDALTVELLSGLPEGLVFNAAAMKIFGTVRHTAQDGEARLRITDSHGASAVLTLALIVDRNDGTLRGDERANRLDGGRGNDLVLGFEGDDTLIGGSGADTIEDGPGYDTVMAGAGADSVSGGDGRDRIELGDGDDIFEDNDQDGANGRDTVLGEAGHDTILGGGGDDSLLGGDGDDSLAGGDDNDVISGGTGFDTLLGQKGNDTLRGDDGRDLAFLGDGDDLYEDNAQTGVNGRDTVYGDGGDDTILGGGGNDRLFGQAGDDSVAGGDDNDLIEGGDGADSLFGQQGNDTVRGGNGQDLVYLGGGNDLFEDNAQTGDNGADSVYGDGGNDTIVGGGGNDSLNGQDGDDSVSGGLGNDTVLGGAGSDTLRGQTGNDLVQSGAGNDLVYLGDGNDRFVDDSTGGAGDTGNDTVHGGDGNDSIRGTDGANVLHGEQGDDTIHGGTGNDRIFGGTGFDTLLGQQGNDTVDAGDGRDLVYLGGGHDRFTDTGQSGANGRDTVYGDGGDDTILGGGGNDLLNGQDGDDSVTGGADDDRVLGGAGADTLEGNDGQDTVEGGDGRDLVYLGAGNDLFLDNSQSGADGQDTVYGGDGADTLRGGGGKDVLHGGTGSDEIHGGQGEDTIFAGENDDTVFAGEQNDLVLGGLGRDRLFLGNGDDRFVDTAQTGIAGQDTVTGGAGVDSFVFGPGIGGDVITDFTPGTDRLWLDDALWAGSLTEAQVVSNFASDTGPDVLFDFGGGNTILLQGVASVTGLSGDLDLF